jgi:MscS family membrane protein
MHWINPSSILRLYLGHIVTLVSLCGAVWLGARLVDFACTRIRQSLERSHRGALTSVFPLAARVLKIGILVFGITGVLKDFGRDTTTILTGLGIGGIAIALASQKTIENLFGSVAVITDRPVHMGDFCKFGNQMGTVEDIGLRSTRIRTVDRTIVTVPNGEFSTMTLENFTPRDKTPLHHTLNLRRDATPDQVRAILRSIEEILKAQAKIEPSDLPVRFTGVGQYSLDVEIFTYILTGDGNEFLRIQQDLLLKILDAVKAAGTALALPTQASVQYVADRSPKDSAPRPAM